MTTQLRESRANTVNDSLSITQPSHVSSLPHLKARNSASGTLRGRVSLQPESNFVLPQRQALQWPRANHGGSCGRAATIAIATSEA